MSSPSDAAPDRSSAAGEETKRRLSRKRVTVITATALSLLEACGLEPSPARSEKTAGKGKKATQGEPPAEKASADDLEERQAAGSASSRERNGGRKKRSAPGRAPREAADAVPQEDASQGVAATKAALPEIPPVIPPADTAAATVPPGPATPPKKTTARRRRASGTKAAPVTDTGAVPATEPAPAFGSVAQEASPPVEKPSVGQSAVEAAASVPGEDQPHSGARRRAVSRAGRAPTSGGRGRKKAAATAPASAGEAGPTTAPVPEQQPAERPMDAAALAAEADRLAAEYGLSSSGGGLVVLPGDDDWDDFPAPPDREASSARTAARGTETVPAASFSESVPSAAPFAAAAPAAPAPEATPAAAKSSPKRRRAGSPKAAPVAEDGPVPVAEAVAQMAPPVEGSFAVRHAADAEAAVPDAGLPQPTAGRRAVSRAGHPAASGGRGRKKAAATTPASAGEAVPTTAPVPERQPAERPMDAAALAAEADRLAAEYGLSSSGGGLVVLPGDDDWDDFPAPPDREASSARTAARGTETVPAASFPEPVPAAAPFAAATPVAPAPEATPAEGKSSPRRRRGGGTTAAPVAGSGNASVPLAGEKGGTSPAAPGDARMPEGSPAPVPGAVSSVSAGHRAEGEANGTARPAASPVAGAPCPAPSSGTGMGRREAAFRQWAADMQARFDAGLEAEEDRAARRKDSLVVLPPPTDTGGRKRRTAKKAQADAAEAPRPRTWITRRRSTEPGHEARFEEWHGPARTGSVLEKVFISLGASPEQAKLSRLWRSWDAVLGPDLAPLARPLGHHDDKLLIGAEDAVLLQELYYMGPEIVRRVNEFLQEDFFTAVKVSLMLDHQDLDAPSPVLERSAGRPKEEIPAPSGASLGLMDPESAVARCYARFLGMELPDPRK